MSRMGVFWGNGCCELAHDFRYVSSFDFRIPAKGSGQNGFNQGVSKSEDRLRYCESFFCIEKAPLIDRDRDLVYN